MSPLESYISPLISMAGLVTLGIFLVMLSQLSVFNKLLNRITP